MKFFEWIDSTIEKVVNFLLVVTIIATFLLSIISITLRLIQIPLFWADPLIRHLVFLSAFLAGIVTTGKGKHLAIDILLRSLEHHPKYHIFLQRIINLASVIGLSWLCLIGLDFFKSELEHGKAQFLEIHSAIWVSIIPIGFVLISYRFLYLFLKTFQKRENV